MPENASVQVSSPCPVEPQRPDRMLFHNSETVTWDMKVAFLFCPENLVHATDELGMSEHDVVVVRIMIGHNRVVSFMLVFDKMLMDGLNGVQGASWHGIQTSSPCAFSVLDHSKCKLHTQLVAVNSAMFAKVAWRHGSKLVKFCIGGKISPLWS